jgi:hypothetical protein
MGVAVVVSKEELGLPVVSMFDLRHRIAELLQTRSRLIDVGWRPVQANALVLFGLDRCTGSLVEHETQVIVAKHAEDQIAFRPHFRIHPESATIDPQAQTLL